MNCLSLRIRRSTEPTSLSIRRSTQPPSLLVVRATKQMEITLGMVCSVVVFHDFNDDFNKDFK